MNKERAEVLKLIGTSSAALGLLFLSSLLAFTHEQKQYIKNRDKEFGIRANRGGCQFPDPHPCNGDKSIQVHHVIPQRFAKEFGIDPDEISNGISLCEYSHQNLLHEDMRQAKHDYHYDKHSYKKAFNARAEELKKKHIYWNDQWDRILHTIIFRSEQRAEKAGWSKPRKA